MSKAADAGRQAADDLFDEVDRIPALPGESEKQRQIRAVREILENRLGRPL